MTLPHPFICNLLWADISGSRVRPRAKFRGDTTSALGRGATRMASASCGLRAELSGSRSQTSSPHELRTDPPSRGPGSAASKTEGLYQQETKRPRPRAFALFRDHAKPRHTPPRQRTKRWGDSAPTRAGDRLGASPETGGCCLRLVAHGHGPGEGPDGGSRDAHHPTLAGEFATP